MTTRHTSLAVILGSLAGVTQLQGVPLNRLADSLQVRQTLLDATPRKHQSELLATVAIGAPATTDLA